MVLASAAEVVVPTAFDRHLAAMAAFMGETATDLELDLFTNFQNAVNEALALATAAAVLDSGSRSVKLVAGDHKDWNPHHDTHSASSMEIR